MTAYAAICDEGNLHKIAYRLGHYTIAAAIPTYPFSALQHYEYLQSIGFTGSHSPNALLIRY